LILVVGGSPEDGRWLEDTLRPTGLAVRVLPLDQALAAAGDADAPARPDVIVLHERRRREDLLDALDRLRADRVLGKVPLVVVDHERDIERFTTAVSRGAAACVCPPLDPGHLRATVLRLARWRDQAGPAERRRRRRRPLLLRVDVHLEDRRSIPGLLRDVSTTGCRLETEERVAPGAAVAITPYGYDASLEFRIAAVVRRYVALEGGRHMLACRFTGTGAVMAPRLFAVQPPRASPAPQSTVSPV
jgi:DNA-binding response OmpR family regulator